MIEFGHTPTCKTLAEFGGSADAVRQFLENYDPFSARTDKRSLESYKDECHQLRCLVSNLRRHIAELTKQMADAATSKADGS